MKTQNNMLTAFLLNLFFSIFEFFGGIISGSYAITADALHDFGDALSIGISLIFENKSKKQPDEKYTCGYGAFSLIGALFTTIVLITGSVLVIINATGRILNPVRIEYGKMILFAVAGVLINSISAFITGKNSGANMKAVNLHMLEDVLGWICVLVGAVVMHFTDLYFIDPLLSVILSLFILFHAAKNLKNIFSVFLQKIPDGISIAEIKKCVLQIDGIIDIHHLHIWSHDGKTNLATMHIVTDKNSVDIKRCVRKELKKHNISHVTLELENQNEDCLEKNCEISSEDIYACNHHCH